AKNLHDGIYSFNGIDSTAFQPPGYPFLLYGLFWVSSHITFLRFANFFFLSCAIACLFWMLKKEEGGLVALLSAALAAIYPLFFYTAGTFFPQMLASMLFLSILALILSEYDGWKKEFAIGLL